MGRIRRLVLVGIAILALLVVLFPPWRASAIRTTTRYSAVPGVVPSTVTDTLHWTLAFAPVYAAPRTVIDGSRMRQLATRSLSGDTVSTAELRRYTEPVERKYHAPEVLRAAGALWRDSVLAAAGIPSLTSYDISFAMDRWWMAARLIVVLVVGLVLLRRKRSGPNLSA